MISLNRLRHSYGDLSVLEELSFTLREGAITCLLGPSGCGKTTLLNLISGQLPLQGGTSRVSPAKDPPTSFRSQGCCPGKP